MRNSTLKNNISELSIDSKCVIIDHMLSNGLKPETIDISTTLMLAFKSARLTKELSEQENQKKQLDINIKELNLQIESLRKTVAYLDEEFTNPIFDAESQSADERSKLIAKATALKRKSNSNKEEMKQLEESVQILVSKRKQI